MRAPRTMLVSLISLLLPAGPAAAQSRTCFRLTKCELAGGETPALHLEITWQNPGFQARTREQNVGHYFYFKPGTLPSNTPRKVIAGEAGSVPLGIVAMRAENGFATLEVPLSKLGVEPGTQGGHLGAAFPNWHTWGDAGKEVPCDIPELAAAGGAQQNAALVSSAPWAGARSWLAALRGRHSSRVLRIPYARGLGRQLRGPAPLWSAFPSR